MSLVAHNRKMARNNAWSNYRLYAAVKVLGPGEFTATRTSFFPSLATTLDHIQAVDLYYLDALEEGGRGLAVFSDRQELDDPAALEAAQKAADARLIAFCDRQTEESLARRVVTDRGEDGRFPEIVADLLAHLFLHQIHHRGQAHAMLAGTSVKPPQLDEYFLVFDSATRRADLAALALQGPEAIG
jgi:uncharacterized damage-inducible protein DinB